MTDLSLTILPETADDAVAIERLHERTFGPGRLAKTAYRIREGTDHALEPVVHRAHRHAAGRLGAADAGAHRRHAGAAARPADGRAAVPRARHRPGADRARARGGEGARPSPGAAGRRRALLRQAAASSAIPKGQAKMPGPVDPARLLVCELAEGAFEGVSGPIRPDWGHAQPEFRAFTSDLFCCCSCGMFLTRTRPRSSVAPESLQTG